ncbi:hypothetical protein THRCLA_04848 [Thraustotheca clavata]|uniref:PHD-type domain-containing protein n=1 Tax=Thraustotheca clavata TaxID=74557 RepID=A0A1V9ZXZ6_9STRA|nr:hypothetical protein THRCLA_04848 [Thraustotheca clavata]
MAEHPSIYSVLPSVHGISQEYERLRHVREAEVSAISYQTQRQRALKLPDNQALSCIDALLELQRRECFRLERQEIRMDQASTHTYVYALRNEDGEVIRPEFVRDRPWPPKEFALRNIPKVGSGRGGGRKRKIPEKTPAQLDEERLAFSSDRMCVDCKTRSSALWRQVEAKQPPNLEAQLVYLKKDDICLNCYVKRTCTIKSRAQLTKNKRKEEKIPVKIQPVVAAPVVPEVVPVVAAPVPMPPVVFDDDNEDDDMSGDEKKRKKSKKSSKKKKKKSKKSSHSTPASPQLSSPRPLAVEVAEEEVKSASNKSKKRAREPSPKVVQKTKAIKTETLRERELRAKGQYCPVCNMTYEDDDASDFICCDSCEKWVHSTCDPQLDALKMQQLADSNAKYVGPCCMKNQA